VTIAVGHSLIEQRGHPHYTGDDYGGDKLLVLAAITCFAPTTFTGGVTADQTFTNGITDDGGVAITRSDLVTIIDAAGMSSGSAYKEAQRSLRCRDNESEL